jgi:hypothetical protein
MVRGPKRGYKQTAEHVAARMATRTRIRAATPPAVPAVPAPPPLRRYVAARLASQAADRQAAADRDAQRLAAGWLVQDTIIEFTDARCGHTWRSLYSKDTVLSGIRSVCYVCHTGFNDGDYVSPRAIITDPQARPTRPYRLDDQDDTLRRWREAKERDEQGGHP